MSNAISRQQALKSMTIWSAIANFEEDAKGTLEVGKDADLVILDTDIMTENLDNIQSVRVLSTFINGEEVYNGGL